MSPPIWSNVNIGLIRHCCLFIKNRNLMAMQHIFSVYPCMTFYGWSYSGILPLEGKFDNIIDIKFCINPLSEDEWASRFEHGSPSNFSLFRRGVGGRRGGIGGRFRIIYT